MTATLSADDLRNLLAFTSDLARKAGKLILEGSHAIQQAPPEAVNEKKNAVDLVTEYDVRVEELVKSEIQRAYPTYSFIGEESYAAGDRPPLTDEPTFCVDPIDGTTNFIHGFPFVCVSIGLIAQKRPVLGVVYNPFLDHLYTGISGQGAHLTHGTNRQALPFSAPKPFPSLSQGLLAIEWGSDRSQPGVGRKADSFLKLAGDPAPKDPAGAVKGGRMAHSLRSMGSAALNFCMVAQGGLDLYWEIGCWPWDVCAASVIAQEAGCIVTGGHNAPHDGVIDEAILTGRKYLVVRPIAGSADEKGTDAQRRIIREFYETVEDYEPN